MTGVQAFREDGDVTPRWPGAAEKFALFAEVMLTGVFVVIAALPLLTIPLALAVGQRHLGRFIRGEGSGVALVFDDFRRGFVRSLLPGLAFLAVVAVLVIDVVVASSGGLPLSPLVGAVGIAGLAAVALALLRASNVWHPASGWGPAVRQGIRRLGSGFAASIYLLAAVMLVAVIAWQLPPLVVPAIGCLCFAVVAVEALGEAKASAAGT